MMIEVVIDCGIMCDFYIVMGECLDDNCFWVVCIYYKFYVCWIWVGGLLMVIGGVLVISDKCYCFRKNVY